MGKGWASLHVMVAEEAKGSALYKDCGFLVERTIAKVIGEARRNTVAVGHLDEVASREGLSLERFKDKEAVKGSLSAADRYGVCKKACCRQKG
jgi:hypothetical protein